MYSMTGKQLKSQPDAYLTAVLFKLTESGDQALPYE